MNVLSIYARLYAGCLVQALRGIRRNAWTLLLPVALNVGLMLLAILVVPLGPLGGIGLALGSAALFSAYLYFVGEIVARSVVSISEFRRSIGAYFWSVLNLAFVLWLVRLVLGFTFGRSPQAGTAVLVIYLLLLILLNAAPEVIYQRHTHGGIATIQAAVKFLHENWLEWIVPNLPLFAAGYLLVSLTQRLGGVAQLVVVAAAGALIHVAFVFRGFVFAELDGTSHRQRVFKHRNA